MLKENFKGYLMVKTDLIYHIPFKNDFENCQVTHFIANLFNDFCVKKWSVMVEKNICVERILDCVKKWFPFEKIYFYFYVEKFPKVKMRKNTERFFLEHVGIRKIFFRFYHIKKWLKHRTSLLCVLVIF